MGELAGGGEGVRDGKEPSRRWDSGEHERGTRPAAGKVGGRTLTERLSAGHADDAERGVPAAVDTNSYLNGRHRTTLARVRWGPTVCERLPRW
jgi:hypothetical protein